MTNGQTRAVLAGVLCAVLGAISESTGAQDAGTESLRKQLEHRNRVILELMERVESLERRLGVPAPAGKQPEDPNEAVAPSGEQSGTPIDRKSEPNRGADGATSRTAPGEVVVDESAAARALERSLTQSGALLLGPGRYEVEPGLAYRRREDHAPAFVGVGGSIVAGRQNRNVDDLSIGLTIRLGLTEETQLEIGVPYRWRRVETGTDVGFASADASSRNYAGIGDLRIGLARTLLREAPGLPDLVGRITWDTDSGHETGDGTALGSGFDEVGASLIAIKRQDPVVFLGAVSYEHAFQDRGVRPGASVSLTLGSFLALNPRTSLQLRLAGTFQQETEVSGRSVGGSDRVAASLVLGGSTLLARDTLLSLTAGIGLTEDADDLSLSLSLVIRPKAPMFQ